MNSKNFKGYFLFLKLLIYFILKVILEIFKYYFLKYVNIYEILKSILYMYFKIFLFDEFYDLYL